MMETLSEHFTMPFCVDSALPMYAPLRVYDTFRLRRAGREVPQKLSGIQDKFQGGAPVVRGLDDGTGCRRPAGPCSL